MLSPHTYSQKPLPSPQHLYGWNNIQPSSRVGAEHNSPENGFNDEPFMISIVIPTLNQGDMIEDTLLSIIYQNYRNIEIIVMDGGSTDHTLEVVERYRPWIKHLISGPDGGQSQAINKGFSLANGDIYAWINSDDYYLPGAFHAVAATFKHQQTSFAVGAGDVITRDHQFLRYIPGMQIDDFAIRNWQHDRWIMQQSCFWSDSLWSRVGGVDPNLNLLMDVDLWFRFSRVTSNVIIPQKLAAMRYYPNAKTVKNRRRSSEELAYVYAKNHVYDAVMDVVSNVNAELEALQQRYDKMQHSIPVRILKRLRLLPLY